MTVYKVVAISAPECQDTSPEESFGRGSKGAEEDFPQALSESCCFPKEKKESGVGRKPSTIAGLERARDCDRL